MWTYIFFSAFIIIFFSAWAALSFAPWVPMRSRDLERVAKMLKNTKGKLLELGSGNGKLGFYLTGKFPELVYLGWDINPLLLIWCQARKLLGWRSNTNFFWQDITLQTWPEADIVFMFGLNFHPSIMEKLNRLPAGTQVISYVFPVPGWVPDQVDHPAEKELKIYSYIKN